MFMLGSVEFGGLLTAFSLYLVWVFRRKEHRLFRLAFLFLGLAMCLLSIFRFVFHPLLPLLAALSAIGMLVMMSFAFSELLRSDRKNIPISNRVRLFSELLPGLLVLLVLLVWNEYHTINEAGFLSKGAILLHVAFGIVGLPIALMSYGILRGRSRPGT